jgi:hypothetical protein
MIGFGNKNKFNCDRNHCNNYVYYLSTYDGSICSEDKHGTSERENYVDAPLEAGTIIEAIFDSQKQQISFVLNGEDCGVAFSNVEDSELYPAIEFHDNNVAITFVD